MDVPLDLPHKSSHALTYLFVHLTWAVAHRGSRLDPSMDAPLERVLDAKARDLHCRLLAFGAAVDHVHVLLRVPPTLSIADVAQGLKESLPARSTSLAANGSCAGRPGTSPNRSAGHTFVRGPTMFAASARSTEHPELPQPRTRSKGAR